MADEPWATAWERAAFGPDGFYSRPETHAEDHFTTNVTRSTATAQRIAEIAVPRLEQLLSTQAQVVVTDVGAADGTLIRQLQAAVGVALSSRLRWRAIDLRTRPDRLDDTVEWITGDVRSVVRQVEPQAGLVIAHELLDDLPCDVLEIDEHARPRLVLVDPRTGIEKLGDMSRSPWAERWWPEARPAARIEVGKDRDETWAAITGLVPTGLAIAVDYGHTAPDRERGLWAGGTLTAYRSGRVVRAVPDGTCNITAHVAMDSCAAAVPRASTDLSQSDDGLWWLVQEMAR